MSNIANGQLAATSTTMVGAAPGSPSSGRHTVNVLLFNTSGSSTETVQLTVSVNGGTARTVAYASLAPHERLYLSNLQLDPADVLYGSATDADTVDYLVSEGSGGPMATATLDANGALKQVNSGISGNQSLTGNLTVSGGTLALSSTSGSSILSLTDNLPDAFSVKQGSNSYITAITTDGGERVKVGKLLGHSLLATPVAAAGAGGGVAGAAALSLNTVVVISSDGATKGVKLNTGAAGDMVFILNSSGTAANLFAASGGTINGGSADAGCAIPASKGVLCICTAADTWTVFDLTAHSGAAA